MFIFHGEFGVENLESASNLEIILVTAKLSILKISAESHNFKIVCDKKCITPFQFHYEMCSKNAFKDVEVDKAALVCAVYCLFM